MRIGINVNKLKGKIVENGMTIEGLANKIGMNRATLYRKMNANGETFSIGEVNAIVASLNLSAADAMSIFFTNIVA